MGKLYNYSGCTMTNDRQIFHDETLIIYHVNENKRLIKLRLENFHQVICHVIEAVNKTQLIDSKTEIWGIYKLRFSRIHHKYFSSQKRLRNSENFPQSKSECCVNKLCQPAA